MTKNPEHIAWDSHWAHLQRAEAPRSRLIPILIKSAYSVCSPAASRRGLGPVLPSRKSGDRPPQDCPACPPGLAGGTATYLGTFRPTVLVSPAGRCSGVTRRAVHPSKRLKARQRYPHGGLGASARLSTRGLNRGNRAFWLGRQHGEHPEPDNATGSIFLFRTTEIRDVQGGIHEKSPTPPHQS